MEQSSGMVSIKKRILLVDDDAISLICLKSILLDEGYDVDTAIDVKSAIESSARQTPDLLVTDIGLPDASGTELLKELQTKYGLPGIALSGYDAQSLAEQSDVEFAGHITKPVDFTKLCSLIERVLQKA